MLAQPRGYHIEAIFHPVLTCDIPVPCVEFCMEPSESNSLSERVIRELNGIIPYTLVKSFEVNIRWELKNIFFSHNSRDNHCEYKIYFHELVVNV